MKKLTDTAGSITPPNIGSATVAFVLALLGLCSPVYGRDFFCAGADIECLFNSILESNFNGEPNTIFLDNGIYQGLQLPSIAGPFPLTIVGQAPENTIIDASGQPLSIGFSVAPQGNLTIIGLTVKRARVHGIGNSGTVNIINTKIDSNSSLGTGAGAGISNSGTAIVRNTTISNNTAFDDAGGGIANSGFMNITDSTIVSNRAGGRITNGGGIVNIGVLHIINTTVGKNGTSGGPIRGGGIHNLSTGGILKITNSTITENSGASGAGIANSEEGITELQNTIVARNFKTEALPFFPTGGTDCGGTITSSGNNLIGDPIDCEIDLQATDLTGDPGLAEYIENASIPGSGHYPLLAGSPATDTANAVACPEVDQLGKERVGICDLGSVEFQGARLLVSIDIRPKNDANRVNPNSSKDINVAIFSGNGFDATTVHASSIRFGLNGTEAAPIHIAQRDVNGDGLRDLVLRFQIQNLGISCGSTSALLTAQVLGGPAISGSTPITTIRCKQRQVAAR